LTTSVCLTKSKAIRCGLMLNPNGLGLLGF